jgi:hypothetical protein
MKDVLVLVAVAFGVYLTAKRFRRQVGSRTGPKGITCDKDGTQMQEISTTEISTPAESPMKAYGCPKCRATKMIPG